MRSSRREFWRDYRELVTFAFTVVTGAASLGAWEPGTARLALRVVALLSGVYLVFRFGGLHRISQLADRRGRDMSAYLDAITRVCDGQTPLYEEEIVLTVVVGANDDEDRITQEFTTKPTPQLVQRLVRPIIPFHQKGQPSLADLDFRCEVDDDGDGVVRVTALPVATGSTPWRIWLVFDPAITALTRWRMTYRPKGLWRPLRDGHLDTLVWNDRVPHDGRSPLTDFRVRFVFLQRDFRPRVVEQNHLGVTGPATRGTHGEWTIEWHDAQPRGHRYTWQIVRVPSTAT